MRTHRVWLEIVVIGAAIALGVALLIASLGFVAAAAAEEVGALRSTAEHEYDGLVTCTRCGARHPSHLAQNASVCVRVCVHGGANFALVNSEASYALDGDPVAFKKLAGERAHVVGILTGNKIKVSWIVSESQALRE